MKQLIFLGLLLGHLAYGQELNLLSPEFEFESGKIYHLYGDQVKLRSGPGTDSEVLKLLDIGTGVKVLEQTTHSQTFKGMDSQWIKVESSGKEGYILGGLIAMDAVVVGEDEYLASMARTGELFSAQVRILRAENTYEELSIDLPMGMFAIYGKGDLGIRGVSSALVVDYISEACGMNGGGTYLFNTEEKLIEAFPFIIASDAGAYSVEEKLIFPNDPEGLEGKVLFKREVMELKDIESNWIETIKTEREMVWEGDRFAPDVRQNN